MVLAALRRLFAMAAVILVIVVMAACSPTPTPSTLEAPTAARTAVAPSLTMASANRSGISTADPEGYVPLLDPPQPFRTVALPSTFGFHRLDSAGPLVVLDQMASVAGPSIYLVNLANETVRTLPGAPTGYTAWAPAISGSTVAWIEWHYEGASNTGALDWRIQIVDVSSASPARTLVRGVQRRAGSGLGASWPALDIDGDQVVYAIEDNTAAPDGWQIVVRTLSGVVVKTIHTREPVYDLAASGGNIAWTEGPVDPGLGYTYATHLYLAKAGQTSGVEIASDAYEVALQDGRLAWSQDSPGGKGAAIGTRIWSTPIDAPSPAPVSPGPGLGTEQQQEWPATGDGIVTWGSYRLSQTDPTQNGDRLGIWSKTLGHATELASTRGAILSGVGGGWIVWVNDHVEPPTVSGITEQALGLQ